MGGGGGGGIRTVMEYAELHAPLVYACQPEASYGHAALSSEVDFTPEDEVSYDEPMSQSRQEDQK